MHTFFINTSDKNVDEGKILFDINYEQSACCLEVPHRGLAGQGERLFGMR